MSEITPPWLDEVQQEIWRNCLRATAFIAAKMEEGLRPFGLDLAEYEILVNLSESQDRRMRMSELADAARQSRSRLTHTVTRLEKRGVVARETCQLDGRGVWAQLTPAGFELLVEAAPQHAADVRRILIDAVEPDDLLALGRAMESVLSVAD